MAAKKEKETEQEADLKLFDLNESEMKRVPKTFVPKRKNKQKVERINKEKLELYQRSGRLLGCERDNKDPNMFFVWLGPERPPYVMPGTSSEPEGCEVKICTNQEMIELSHKGKLVGNTPLEDGRQRVRYLPAVLVALGLMFLAQFSYAAVAPTDEKVLGQSRWSVQNDGDFVPGADSTYSIAEPGNEVDNLYLDNLYIGLTTATGNQTSTGTITFSSNLLTVGIADGGATVMASDILGVPLTYDLVYKYIGSDAEALTLANGKTGQLLKIIIDDSAGGAATLTPTTSTGFDTALFNARGDWLTLQYVNDTYGWVPVGSNSVTFTID